MENAAQNNLSDSASLTDPGWTLRQRLLLDHHHRAFAGGSGQHLSGRGAGKAHDTGDVRAQLIQSAKTTAADEENVLSAGEQILRAMGA